MTTRRLQIATVVCLTVLVSSRGALALDLDFKAHAVQPKGRIDAIAHLGNGVVVAGSREANSTGYVFVSKDYGATWRTVGNITGSDFITCLCSGGDGLGYLLTGKNVHVWRTTDYGATWTDMGRVSKANSGGAFANAYGMATTPEGTILVADGDGKGGHIHRSTDNGMTWRDMGKVSPKPLYRLNAIKDGMIVNGWAGNIYKSTDDGMTWTDMGNLTPSPLYAIEYLEDDGTVLIASESGHVFRSTNNCKTWEDVGKIGDAADDFAWLGGGRVLYSTYTGSRHLHLSEDSGATWTNIGPLATEPNDWLDHFICIHDAGMRRLIGGTNKGYIVYAGISE